MDRIYLFGSFRLDAAVGLLGVGGRPTALGSRAVKLLAALLDRANEFVGKAELLDIAWPGLFVEEANLSVQISAIRRVLAEHGEGAVRIETLARRGYRFVGAVAVEEPAAALSLSLAPLPGFAAERDAFVGRTVELRALAEHLHGGARLVTLTGSGGSGKTRLARRFGRSSTGWPGGTYFCDLSDARGLDGLHFAVATGLGVSLPKGDPAVLLGHAIAGRGRCLIVLDNFEQLVVHASESVGSWIERAPEASIVVTSRQRLHLAGELVFPVEPLPLDTDAVELFQLRARAQRPELRLDGDDVVPVIAEIVRLLDGLPLAIELAAARVRILSLPQIVERLGDRFRILRGATNVVARQATLQAAIDWSWELLAPREQAALAACSVFEGGFTLPAAEAVLDLTGEPGAPEVLEVVQSLVDKSLIRLGGPGDENASAFDEPQFGMYLSIHEYAKGKLDALGATARRTAEERHGRFFARLGSEDALAALSGRDGIRRRHELIAALDNLMAALQRAASRGSIEVLVPAYQAAWEVLERRGPSDVGAALGELLPSLDPDSDALLLGGHLTWARALWRAGQVDAAARRLRAISAIARERGYPRLEGQAAAMLGNIVRGLGQMAEAREHLERALALARACGDAPGEAVSHSSLGTLMSHQSKFDEAETSFLTALAMFRVNGESREEASLLGNLANLYVYTNRFQEARDRYAEGLVVASRAGDQRTEGVLLGNMANVADLTGQHDEALRLSEAALAIHRRVGNRGLEGNVLGNIGELKMARGDLDGAKTCLKAAIQIVIEAGDRRLEGLMRWHLGRVYTGQGALEEARQCLELAVEMLHSMGGKRQEGTALGSLGEVLAGQGFGDQARTAFEAGAALLRETNGRRELAILLCARGTTELAFGDREQAVALLSEAESLARLPEVEADVLVHAAVQGLRCALGRTTG